MTDAIAEGTYVKPPRYRNMIRPALWDLSQKLFGADEQKKQLYFSSLKIQDRDAPILDFGCATGNASEPFIGYNYTGIDNDAALIEFASFKFRRHPEMRFVAADILSYTGERPFEYILFASVAHHLDDVLLQKILLRLRTMLSATGHIYFIDPVITGHEGTLLRALMNADQGKFHRSAASYEYMFEKWGFEQSKREALHAEGTLFPQPEYAFIKIR